VRRTGRCVHRASGRRDPARRGDGYDRSASSNRSRIRSSITHRLSYPRLAQFPTAVPRFTCAACQGSAHTRGRKRVQFASQRGGAFSRLIAATTPVESSSIGERSCDEPAVAVPDRLGLDALSASPAPGAVRQIARAGIGPTVDHGLAVRSIRRGGQDRARWRCGDRRPYES